MQWIPLFSDPRERIIFVKKAEEIALEFENIADESLFIGKAGISIFFYYLTRLTGNKEYQNRANALIEQCLDAVYTKGLSFPLESGTSGIIWTLLNLSQSGFISVNLGQSLDSIDEYVYLRSRELLNVKYYDYLTGGLSAGLYFLQRLPQQRAVSALEEIVDHLFKNAEKVGSTITWSCPKIHEEEVNIKGPIYNLGLAHGVPSIIYFLSQVYHNNIAKKKCFELIIGSVNWLLSQKTKSESLISMYPHRILTNNEEEKESRLGWCYGDLGIANCLFIAGKSLGNECWKEEAIKILLKTSERRNLTENSVWDAILCHGTAGIAHIFNRFFQQTGIEKFKDTAIFWFNETLKMAKHEDGNAGFKHYRVTKENIVDRENCLGLLNGVAGIGLALIGGVSFVEPKWDKCILLS